MSTAATSADGCQPCDLEGVEGLTCRAEKYSKQAEIMTQLATDLATYRTQYGEARKSYAAASENTQADIDAVKEQLDELYDLLKCRLKPEHKKECLDEAATEVFDDIDECSPDPGCCSGDCEFDESVDDDDTVETLTARIEDYRRTVKEQTACFTSLVTEAKLVTDQVAEIKAQVTALAVDVKSSDDAKLPRLYARWLIASRRIQAQHLGHGFTSVSAFTDCLCNALQCIASGGAAIVVLEGAKAELACYDRVKEAACKVKVEQTLEAILEAYDRCCRREKPTGEEKPDTPYAQVAQAGALERG